MDGNKGSQWQAWSIQLEEDLKKAEEDNNKLRQENRNLRTQLIQAGPQHYLQQQLSQAQQDATHNKNTYIKHLDSMQQQLAIAKQAKEAAVRQAAETERAHNHVITQLANATQELEKHQSEAKRLQALLVEREKQLLQARSSPPQQLTGAVSYQHQIAVLQRQLQLSQNENARLLGHSNVKPGQRAEESDDSEPEVPAPKPDPAKAKNKVTQKNLNAGPCRPQNYSRGPPSGTYPPRVNASQGIVTPSPTPTPHAASAPQPLTTVKQADAASNPIPKTSRVSIDLTSDGEPTPPSANQTPAQPPAPSSLKLKLKMPTRSSLHENITIAPRPPRTQAPLPTADIAPAQSSVKVESALKSSPSTKRKRNTAPDNPSSPPSTKRQRNKHLELRDELSDLTIDATGFDAPPDARPRRRESYEEDWPSDTSSLDSTFGSSLKFRFTAICAYDGAGEVADNFPSSDLEDCVGALWERVRAVEERWQASWGEDWQWEFRKRKGKGRTPVCVMQKCRKKVTEWGKGEEVGKYACVDCVKMGLPCFTFVKGGEAGEKGGFRLLPLRTEDRKLPVEKGQETRYWINDGKFVVEEEDEMVF